MGISDYLGFTELDWISYDHIDSEDPDSKLIAAWCGQELPTTAAVVTTVQSYDWPECYYISGEPLHPEMIGRWELMDPQEYEGDCDAVYKHNETELYDNVWGMGINMESMICDTICT